MEQDILDMPLQKGSRNVAVGFTLTSFLVGHFLFFLALWILDRAIGNSLDHCLQNVSTGDVTGGLVNTALKNSDSDILVFGSSLARYHVDCRVFNESTKPSCFNVGCDGQNIYYARMLEDLLIREGCHSKVFVYLLNWSDLYQDNLAAAKVFNSFRDRSDVVSEVLDGGEWTNQIKCLSHIYRYNGRAVSLVRHYLWPEPSGISGFVPLNRAFTESRVETAQMLAEAEASEVDAVSKDRLEKKLEHYRKFIDRANQAGIRVVFVTGPTLRQGIKRGLRESYALKKLQQIAEENSAQFLILDEEITELAQPSLYCDRRHLNESGAKRFTHLLKNQLIAQMPDLGTK